MTRRAFSAKQCSESSSAAAGFFRSLALAPFLASSAGEAFRGCSGGPGAEFDQRIVLRPCRLGRASLCAAVGANATLRRALATASRQQNLPAARTRLRMTALMALTGLVRRTPGKQPQLARRVPGVPRVKHMTRRAFSAKQRSESNSAAAGIFRRAAAAQFLANSVEDVILGASKACSSESDHRMLLRRCRLARASLCAAFCGNAAFGRALALNRDRGKCQRTSA